MTLSNPTSPIDRASGAEAQAEDRFPAPKWYPQQASWVREPHTSNSAAYNYPLPLRIRGPLDRKVLQQSLQEIVRRHQVLRSVFEIRDGNVFQIVLQPQPFSILERDLSVRGQEAGESKARQLAIEGAQRPFDLTCEPLLRATLLQLGTDDYVLLLTTHHIVCDDWSTGILLREFSLLYSAYSAGNPPALPPVPYPYGEFARQLARQMQSRETESRIQFWRERLASGGDFHHLATDHPRSSRQTYAGAHEVSVFSEQLLKGIKMLSQRERVSPFMLLVAAFQCLLLRYSGQEDIGIASCVANRNSTEVEGLIGPFSNRVVLRTDLSGNPTFRDVLNRVRNVALDAYSHQDLPFGELVEKIAPIPNPSRNPLFQVLMILRNAPKERWELPQLTLSWFPIDTGTTRYDLNVWLQFKDGLEIDLQYNTDLFDPSTMRRILEDYRRMLEAALANPQGRIDELLIPMQSRPGPAPVEDSPEIEAAPPRDEIEKQLSKIWEELLGVRPIGLRQNYFELGGDSLRAARLFAQIEKIFQIQLPLATLFQAPTIEGLARIVRERGSSVSWSSLVAVQPGGTRPPLFLTHGAGGNVLIYRDLARYLGPDQPVYGLQSQGLDGKHPFLNRIEDMAALYVKEIRSAQPKGPYFLGGYCMGGTVALEMAQQLRGQGQEVALLALIDTLNWAEVTANSFLDQLHFNLQKIAFHWQNFWLLDLNDKLKFLRGKLKVLKSRSRVWFGMLLGKFVKGDQGERSASLIFAQLWDANERAAFDYAPRVYPGRAIQFRPLRQYARYDGQERGWDRLALEGVEVHDLLVYPGGMLAEPFVGQLAAELGVCIVKALRQ